MSQCPAPGLLGGVGMLTPRAMHSASLDRGIFVMLTQYDFKVIPPNPIAKTIRTQLQGSTLGLVQAAIGQRVCLDVAYKLQLRNNELIGCSTPTYGDLVW